MSALSDAYSENVTKQLHKDAKEILADMPKRYFNDSEIASLKQQATAAKEAAIAEQKRRGQKINPRILAARRAGQIDPAA